MYHTSHVFVSITCPITGEFQQKAYRLLAGGGCSECGVRNRVRNQQEWIEAAEQIHHNKYDYSLVKYIASNKKVKINCSFHGVFEQEPQLHERGHGCSKCGNENKGGSGGVYCDSYFSSHKNERGYFYVAQFENKQERFVKIGITKLPFYQRFSSQQQYKITPLMSEPMTLCKAYNREQQIKNENHELLYTPKQKFGGYTECFSENLLDRLSG